MVSLFSKPIPLAPMLKDLVDIHNHLLPGIDDGSPSVAVSQEMIALYQELGYSGVIATPHSMEGYYENSRETIRAAFDLLHSNAGTPKHIPFHASSEYMLDSRFDQLLEDKQITPLHGDMILVEMSYFKPPMDLENKLFNIRTHDFVPILAHPERYAFIKDKRSFQDLKNRGCFFQLNLLSLSGHYGKDARNKADLLLREGMIDYVGTDAHKPAHLKMLKRMQIPKKFQAPLEKAIARTMEVFG